MNPNPLTRSKDDRMLLGVCGGIAEWLGWDPTVVRVAYVVVSMCSAAFPGIFAYLVLAIVMPPGGKANPAPPGGEGNPAPPGGEGNPAPSGGEGNPAPPGGNAPSSSP